MVKKEIQAEKYISEVREIREKLSGHPKLRDIIKLDSRIHVGIDKPKLLLGNYFDWYVNINTGIVYIRTYQTNWMPIDNLIGGNVVKKYIYSYAKTRPTRPWSTLSKTWSTRPLTVDPIKGDLWVSQADYIDGFKVGLWTPPAIHSVRRGAEPNLYDYWTLRVKKLGILYGALYNHHAVVDERELTSSEDWYVMETYNWVDLIEKIDENAEGDPPQTNVAGGLLKEEGTENWMSPNTDATNSIGMTIRPGGSRNGDDGTFSGLQYSSIYRRSDISNSFISFSYNSNVALFIGELSNNQGAYIRLINLDTELSIGETGTYVGNDGRVYKTICIDLYGPCEILAENLVETKYRDGSDIPIVTDNAEWAALTTGAMCYYNNDPDYGYTEVDDDYNIEDKNIVEVIGENIGVEVIEEGGVRKLMLTAEEIPSTPEETDPIFIDYVETPRDANTVLAGPVSGAAAAPAFRGLVADDIPPLAYLPDSTVLPQTESGAANNFLTAYNASTGVFSKARPTWDNISGKPTNVSHFTNDSGYITSTDIPESEPPLGNPSENGQILSSTTAGVRSWVDKYTNEEAIVAIKGDTAWNADNWDTAYGWGNHADVGYVTGTPWTAMGYITEVTPHNLLSSIHGDTDANSVDIGDLIVGKREAHGHPILWTILSKGTAGQVLTSDGANVVWDEPQGSKWTEATVPSTGKVIYRHVSGESMVFGESPHVTWGYGDQLRGVRINGWYTGTLIGYNALEVTQGDTVLMTVDYGGVVMPRLEEQLLDFNRVVVASNTGRLGYVDKSTLGGGTYTAGDGITLTGSEFSVAAGEGLTQTTGGLQLTSISAGADTNGALRYNSVSQYAGRLFGGTTFTISDTTRLNYGGNFYAHQLYENNGGSPARVLTDAPSDGTIYGRKDAAWVAATGDLVASTISTTTPTISLATNHTVQLTNTGNLTITVNGGTSGKTRTANVIINTHTSAREATWTAGIFWQDDVKLLDLVAGWTYFVTIISHGTTYYASFTRMKA